MKEYIVLQPEMFKPVAIQKLDKCGTKKINGLQSTLSMKYNKTCITALQSCEQCLNDDVLAKVANTAYNKLITTAQIMAAQELGDVCKKDLIVVQLEKVEFIVTQKLNEVETEENNAIQQTTRAGI